MNTMNDLYRKHQGHSLTACPPEPPVCTTCGMLECLCRPRFFPGQILTADDLNLLDRYIRGKNRLHNRQLHGWGVVNGLEVTCNPCGDGVAVGCGYALSPCGDDIVVCEAVAVDVCALIRRCKDAERKWQQCKPFQHPQPQDCDAGEEEWILAIRYAEAPSRGVKPLRPMEECLPDCGSSTGCACGGGTSGKCGCGGACGGSQCSCGTKTKTKPRGAPVQCEPTVICEGFAFEVYRKPAEKPSDPPPSSDNAPQDAFNPNSDLYKRFQCCTKLLITDMPPLPGTFSLASVQANPQAWFQWMNAARMQLSRYFKSHGAYNCELLDKMNSIVYPTAGTAANANAIFVAVTLLLIVWLDAILACWCSALLPPCPGPSHDVRVPLASIHVAGHPCRVIRICNWSIHRKFAVTFPALQYWLGIFPFGVALRKLLETICCFDFGIVLPQPDPQVPGVAAPPGMMMMMGGGIAGGAAGGGGAAGAVGANEVPLASNAYGQANALLNPVVEERTRVLGMTDLVSNAVARAGKTMEFSTLVDSVLLSANKREAGKEYLSAAEVANLPQFLLANQLARPIAMASMPEPLAAMMSMASMFEAPPAASTTAADDIAAMRSELAELRSTVEAGREDDVAAMRSQLAKLKRTVDAQSETIKRLETPPKPPAKRRGNR